MLFVRIQAPMQRHVSRKHRLRANSPLSGGTSRRNSEAREHQTNEARRTRQSRLGRCRQTVYWPISFEAEHPGPAATKLVLAIFAYRNPLGKWDANVKTLETQAAGISQEIPENMLKQLGL
jgi:hypothetical protein